MAILDILARFLHILAAVLAVGGAFFMLVLLPAGLRLVDESRRDEVLLKIRRAFKMTVHPAILFLIATGVYNTIKLWPAKNEIKIYHPFWGPHVILGLIVMIMSLWLLAGPGLRAKHRTWLKVNVVLMVLTILAGSGARWARLDIVKGKLAQWEADKQKLAELQGATAASQPATQPK